MTEGDLTWHYVDNCDSGGVMIEIPWDAEPHTKAKHDLYRRYLDRWMPIIVRSFGGRCTYAEGFAGPGFYKDGSPGSPVIALRALLNHQELKGHARNVRLLFVDRE